MTTNRWIAFVKNWLAQNKDRRYSYADALKYCSKIYTKKPKTERVKHAEGLTWTAFVLKIKAEQNLTYKEALNVASPLWRTATTKKSEPEPPKPEPQHECPKQDLLEVRNAVTVVKQSIPKPPADFKKTHIPKNSKIRRPVVVIHQENMNLRTSKQNYGWVD